MAPPKLHRLGDLQLQIMKVLWARGEAAVADIQSSVPDGDQLAYTTVATMLRKMEVRGLVAHRTDGRSFVYRACVPEDKVSQGMTDHVLDRLFGGSVAALLNNLLTTREVSRDELAQLEKLIAQRKKQP